MRQLKKELWPTKVTINTPVEDTLNDIHFWLEERTGQWKDKWNVVHGFRTTDYYFRNEQDATLFTLRWGN